MMLMLQGCAGSGPPLAVTKPVLPPAPAQFGVAVDVPAITAGLDARALAARERAALLEANRRLSNDGDFYQSVLNNY